VQHWRLRFAEVQAQLDEIAGKPVTREADLRTARRQDVQAAVTPSFQARLRDANTVQITSAHLKTCTVRWHRLDLEPLFSRAPFTSASASRATLVRPVVSQEVVLAADGSAVVAFPAELHHQAIAVEVAAAGQSQVLTSFADALDVRLSPGTGQVQVLHAVTGKPLPATYVKVYVERGEDRAIFHKDGYTDLRGRFDYASLGDGSIAGAKRIALFISNDDAGATVREVSPP
jgi:transcriptional regulator of met regulon